jgi:hypothetical protein
LAALSDGRTLAIPNIMKKGMRVFKIADIVIQSLLFIVFAVILSLEDNQFAIVTSILIYWQIFSVFVHLFLRRLYRLKTERLAWLIVAFLYVVADLYASSHIKETELLVQDSIRVPIVSTSFATFRLLFAFWYYTISFRELKKTVKSSAQVSRKKELRPMKPSNN